MRPAYEWAINRLTQHAVPWTINGHEFLVDARFRGQIGHAPDQEASAFLATHIAPGEVVFNVGANVGVHVLPAARRVGPTGRVVAFEPNPEACQVLRHHVQINGFADRVTVVEAAVGSAPGRAVLHATGSDPRSRLGTPNAALVGRTRPIDVLVVTLDDWAETAGLVPDCVIVDVEGFEERVLDGARRLLTGHPGIQVLVEMHPASWTDAGTTRATLDALLTNLGRTPQSLSGLADPLGAHGLTALLPF
jgi:FkbM family methyltransferase